MTELGCNLLYCYTSLPIQVAVIVQDWFRSITATIRMIGMSMKRTIKSIGLIVCSCSEVGIYRIITNEYSRPRAALCYDKKNTIGGICKQTGRTEKGTPASYFQYLNRLFISDI